MGSDDSHFNFSVGSDGQSHKTVSANHNLPNKQKLSFKQGWPSWGVCWHGQTDGSTVTNLHCNTSCSDHHVVLCWLVECMIWVWFQCSEVYSLLHLIAANISHQQWTCIITKSCEGFIQIQIPPVSLCCYAIPCGPEVGATLQAFRTQSIMYYLSCSDWLILFGWL